MTIRNIRKQLIVKQDLALGKGKVVQRRGDENRELDKLDLVMNLSSQADIDGLVGDYDGQQISMRGFHPDSGVGGGVWYWKADEPKANHTGGTKRSPTVPFTGATLANFLDGVGETDVGGSGCWVRNSDANKNLYDFGAKPEGSFNSFPALAKAVSLGGCVIASGHGQMLIESSAGIDVPAGATVLQNTGDTLVMVLKGAGAYLFNIGVPRVFVQGLRLEGHSTDPMTGVINRTFSSSDDWTWYSGMRISLISVGIRAESTGSAGSFLISKNRFNQVSTPILNMDGGVNVLVKENYMLGCNIGIDIRGPNRQPEGWLISDNIILPNKVNAVGVKIAAGLSMGMTGNMIDQVGSGGTAVYLDASTKKLEDIVLRDKWYGSVSSGALYGVRGAGDLRNLTIATDEINQFEKNIELESLGAGKKVLFPRIDCRHLRPGNYGIPGQIDINLIGEVVGVSYGAVYSQSETSLFEGSDVTVSVENGFYLEGQVQRANMSAPVAAQVAYIGGSKSSGTPGYGYGFATSGSNARILIPLPNKARRAPLNVDLSGLGDYSIRHPGGTASVTGISLNSATDTGITLDVTTSGLTTGQSCIFQMSGSGYISMR